MLSATLAFDRSGRHLVAVEPDVVAVVDLTTSTTRRFEYRDVRAAAAFDDQLWIATHDLDLVRLDASGRVLGRPVRLPSAVPSVLVLALCGPAAAVWSGVAYVDDFNELVPVTLPAADAIITRSRCDLVRQTPAARSGRLHIERPHPSDRP